VFGALRYSKGVAMIKERGFKVRKALRYSKAFASGWSSDDKKDGIQFHKALRYSKAFKFG
jgi:hypothetical protein